MDRINEVEYRLCRIILPPEDIKQKEPLYIQKKGNIRKEGETLVFGKGDMISFGTYFNSMPIGIWKKYTQTGIVRLRIVLSGTFQLRLCRAFLHKGRAVRKILRVFEAAAEHVQVYEYPIPDSWCAEGIVYFELQAQADGSRMTEASYYTRAAAETIRPVKLALGICTYQREAFLLKNLALIAEKIKEPDCQLRGHLEIFVADNGHTLKNQMKQFPLVHGFENPNFGGTAGFVRCMLEALRANECGADITHMLLMDDDIRLEWESIERTYVLLCLLKQEYLDAWIGGAMLRADHPYIQEESGGIFGRNGNLAIHKGLDLRVMRDCLKNDQEHMCSRHADYNAWWYCCFPMNMLDSCDQGLPLPLFIHGDDVEWGRRNQKHLIRMNGICVWHEPLEEKTSAERLYYDIRNLLICHALHDGDAAGMRMAAFVLKQFVHEAGLFRYRYIAAIVHGVEDFLKGPGFLANTNAEDLHQKLLTFNYKKHDVRSLHGKIPWEQVKEAERQRHGTWERVWKMLLLNGCFLPGAGVRFLPDGHCSFVCAWHSRRLVFADKKNQTCYMRAYSKKQLAIAACRAVHALARMIVCYDRLAGTYRLQSPELMTRRFWETYLGMAQIRQEIRKEDRGKKKS